MSKKTGSGYPPSNDHQKPNSSLLNPRGGLRKRTLGSFDGRDYPSTKQTHPSTAERGDPRTRKLRSPFSLEDTFIARLRPKIVKAPAVVLTLLNKSMRFT